MLIKNINLNILTNVVALNYAVYSKETMIKLYLPTVNGHIQNMQNIIL